MAEDVEFDRTDAFVTATCYANFCEVIALCSPLFLLGVS
jgi:hypothetical protein